MTINTPNNNEPPNIPDQQTENFDQETTINKLPNEILINIFDNLSTTEIGIIVPTSRRFHEIGKEIIDNRLVMGREKYRHIIFGKEEWERYFGKVGEEPPLPRNIFDIVESKCPYFNGKIVHESHLLFLMVESVNGAPLTLKNIGKFVRKPNEGNRSSLETRCPRFKDVYIDTPQKGTYWVLMTKETVETDLQNYYDKPTLLEAVSACFLHHVGTGERMLNSTNKEIRGDKYSSKSNSEYTECRNETIDGEKLYVGDFGESLTIRRAWKQRGCLAYPHYFGVSGVRRFIAPQQAASSNPQKEGEE